MDDWLPSKLKLFVTPLVLTKTSNLDAMISNSKNFLSSENGKKLDVFIHQRTLDIIQVLAHLQHVNLFILAPEMGHWKEPLPVPMPRLLHLLFELNREKMRYYLKVLSQILGSDVGMGLKSLDLQMNQDTDEAQLKNYKMHGHGVELGGRKLQSLNILKFKFMASKSDKEYIIRPILGSVSSLKKLKLSVDGDESEDLFSLLSPLQDLHSLDISFATLTNDLLLPKLSEHFLQSLSHIPSLSHLALSNSPLSDADILKLPTTLRKLSLKTDVMESWTLIKLLKTYKQLVSFKSFSGNGSPNTLVIDNSAIVEAAEGR